MKIDAVDSKIEEEVANKKRAIIQGIKTMKMDAIDQKIEAELEKQMTDIDVKVQADETPSTYTQATLTPQDALNREIESAKKSIASKKGAIERAKAAIEKMQAAIAVYQRGLDGLEAFLKQVEPVKKAGEPKKYSATKKKVTPKPLSQPVKQPSTRTDGQKEEKSY